MGSSDLLLEDGLDDSGLFGSTGGSSGRWFRWRRRPGAVGVAQGVRSQAGIDADGEHDLGDARDGQLAETHCGRAPAARVRRRAGGYLILNPGRARRSCVEQLDVDEAARCVPLVHDDDPVDRLSIRASVEVLGLQDRR
jgi:hypothetical protein